MGQAIGHRDLHLYLEVRLRANRTPWGESSA